MEYLDLIADYALTQQVSCATHDAGGTLDVVCTQSDLATPTVDCRLACCCGHVTTSSLAIVQTRRLPDRPAGIHSSDDRCWQGLDGDALGQLYDDTITRLLDHQIPAVVAVLPTHGSTTNAPSQRAT